MLATPMPIASMLLSQALHAISRMALALHEPDNQLLMGVVLSLPRPRLSLLRLRDASVLLSMDQL
jgi:hypothetical protein